MKSIRRTLLGSLLAGVVLAAISCGTLFHHRIQRTLTDQFDAALFAKAQAVAALLELEGVQLAFDFNPELMPEFSREENPEFFQISLPEGELLNRSPKLGSKELPLRFGSASKPEFFDLELPDGQAGRGAGILVTVRDDGETDDEEAGAPPAVTVPPEEALSIDVVLVYARSRAELDGT
ncbi:MAG: sensor histidine kinase N-terminal domain-containing protein, partial [Planctomycetota bacterium]